VINAGHLDVGGSSTTGVLTINGSFTQTTFGVLSLKLGGTAVGTGYDQLHVNGAVTLDGALVVSLINGFHPAPGDRFQVLTFTARTGDFSSQSLPGLDPVYSSTALTLVAP